MFADDVTTNTMSPVVSYQYAEDFGNEAFTNGGVSSPFVSFQYLEDFSGAALSEGGIISPIVSYQYFEWPGNDVLQLQRSPRVSYYYQFGRTPGSLIVHGRVTDTNGAPLSGATVSAMIYLTPMAQANTDANGNYQMPFLDAGVYNLSAWDATHQTSMRALTLGPSTVEQNFHLQPMPSAPNMVRVNRDPVLTYASGPQGSAFKIFDGIDFVLVTPSNAPSRDVMTIVLTHGWINPIFSGGVDDWPTMIATKLRANGITSGIANIVAWDWRNAATGIFAPQVNVPGQGVALGTNLFVALGENYSHSLHFFGHSLGTMVNAAAINFLHGDQISSTRAAVSPNPWPVDKEPFIHITMFDDAAAASANTTEAQLFFDGNTVSQTLSPLLLSGEDNTTLTYSPPLPVHFTWADNYVSLFGFYHANAVNVLLQRSIAHVGLIGAHSYAQQWYAKSISDPTNPDNPLGFQRSLEFKQKNHIAPEIPPTGLNDAYLQSSPFEELALWPIPFGLGPPIVSSLGTTFGTGVQAGAGAIQFAGDAWTDVIDAAQWSRQKIAQGFNYVSAAAAQGRQTVVNLFSAMSISRISLTTGPFNAFQPANGASLQPLFGHALGGETASNTPAMVWLPLFIPKNAKAMAFDFILSGNPHSDALVCGIGTNNLFSLEAKYIPTNNISTSSLIDVAPWAGTTNELFFGFLGGTSTNATLEIASIRFYNLEGPRLTIRVTNSVVALAWPISAGGYLLEGTDTLITTNWSPITEVPVIANLQYTTTNELSPGYRFFRLRQP